MSLYHPCTIPQAHGPGSWDCVGLLDDLVRVERPFPFNDLSLYICYHMVEVGCFFLVIHVNPLRPGYQRPRRRRRARRPPPRPP